MGVFSRTNPTAAFNYVISQIASGDVTASTQALVQFEKVIRNKNHKEVSKHIDQVRIVFFTYALFFLTSPDMSDLEQKDFAYEKIREG